MREVNTTLSILSCFLIAGLSMTGALSAQGYPLASGGAAAPVPAGPVFGNHAALGVSLFVGPTSGDPYELITAFDQGTIYTASGNGVEATDAGIILRRNGIYRIHLEGVLALDADDPTADEGASALFSIVVNDEPWVVCSTPDNTAAPTLAADWRFTPDHEQVAACKVDFTIEVRGAGSDPGVFPIVFPKNTAVQAALIPNDLALGDATLLLTRFEISRAR